MRHRASPSARRVLNAVVGVVHNTDMNDPQSFDIRRRIRELLAIPDRDRSDAEWDELNELEIRTAPGNRDNGYTLDRGEGKRGFTSGRRSHQGQKNANSRQENWLPQENRPDVRRQENKNRSPLKRSHRRAKSRPPRENQTQGSGQGGTENGYPAGFAQGGRTGEARDGMAFTVPAGSDKNFGGSDGGQSSGNHD